MADSIEVTLWVWGPEDAEGVRQPHDLHQIPGDRHSWRRWFGEVRARTPEGGVVHAYKTRVDANRKPIAMSPTPYTIFERKA